MPRKFIKSVGHALYGLRLAWSGRNFRIHVLAFIALVIFLDYFKFTYLESTILLTLALLVLMSEIFNSALEHLLDVLEPEHHPAVGRIKDMAAGAVLLVSIGALLIFICIALHHFGIL